MQKQLLQRVLQRTSEAQRNGVHGPGVRQRQRPIASVPNGFWTSSLAVCFQRPAAHSLAQSRTRTAWAACRIGVCDPKGRAFRESNPVRLILATSTDLILRTVSPGQLTDSSASCVLWSALAPEAPPMPDPPFGFPMDLLRDGELASRSLHKRTGFDAHDS